jgi:hypothetical protein
MGQTDRMNRREEIGKILDANAWFMIHKLAVRLVAIDRTTADVAAKALREYARKRKATDAVQRAILLEIELDAALRDTDTRRPGAGQRHAPGCAWPD